MTPAMDSAVPPPRPAEPRASFGGLSQDAVDAVQRMTGGSSVVSARRLEGGVSRSGWLLEMSRDVADQKRLYLRVGPQPEGPVAAVFSVIREAEIVQDLAATGLAVPRVIGVSAPERLAVMEFVDGVSDMRSLASSQDRSVVAGDYLQSLVQLHRVDPRSVRAFADAPTTVGEAVRADLDVWLRLVPSQADSDDPLLSLAAQWLLGRIPVQDSPPSVVHGDAGPGNFLFRDNRVAAMVDWELSHVGDPLEDLGWIILRARTLSRVDIRGWLAEYARLTQTVLTESAVEYHRVVALFKTIVAIESSLAAGVAERIVSLLSLRAFYRCQLVRILMDGLGVTDAAPIRVPPARPTLRSQVALEGAEALQQSLDPEGASEAERVGLRTGDRALRYLEREAALWPALVEDSCREARQLLGRIPNGIDELLREVRPLLELEELAGRPEGLVMLSRIERRRLSLWPRLAAQFDSRFHSTSALTNSLSI